MSARVNNSVDSKFNFKIAFATISLIATVLFLPINDARADCTTDPATLNVVSHDLAGSYCELCGTGQIRVVISNPDTQQLTNLTIAEDLSASGLEYVPGSTIFNGVSMPLANPVIASSVLTWTTTEIPALASLAGGTTRVLEFRVRAVSTGTEEDLVTAARQINASVTFDFANCPTPPFPPSPPWPRTTDSTGVQTLQLREPVPTVTKLGRNVDAAQGGYTPTVYGNTNDDVIWQITIANSGLAGMQDVIFSDLMTAGNMSVNYACPSEAAALMVTNNNGVDPGGTGCVVATNSISAFSQVGFFGNPAAVDVPAGGSASVYLVGKVTSSCVNGTNTASDVQWGCQVGATGDGGITTTSTGMTPADATTILSTVVTNSGLQIQRQITGINAAQPVGTKGTITITITNNTGGTVKNIQLNNVLPTGPAYYVVDSTFTPTIVVNPVYGNYPGITDLINWTNQNVDPLLNTSPIFTLTSSTTHPDYADQSNMLRNGDVLVVTFRIVMTNATYYDIQADLDVRTELAGVDDPANMPPLTNQLYVTFEQFCSPGTTQQASSYPFNDSFTPSPEDIDIDVSGPELIFILTNDPAQLLPLRVQLTNNGGNDAADHYTYVSFGETMNVVTVPGSCALTTNPPPRPVWNLPTPPPATATIYECTSGAIAPGATRNLDFEVNKNLASTADDLTFRADTVAEVTLSDGTPLVYPTPSDPIGSTINNYSLDGIRARVLGFNLTKSQSGICTENNPPPASPDTDVQIGEECTFRIETGGWFGFQTPGFTYIAVQNIQVVDELPNGQGYISSTDPMLTSDPTVLGINLNPAGLTAPDAGWVDWTFNQVVPAERITVKDQWFRVDIDTRLLNDPIDTVAAPNQHAATSRNILNSTFEAIFTDTFGIEQVFSLGP
ncbi:MAG: hypothetical protein ACC641_08070, partial [Acidiferrobacterales bacterium]